MVIVTPKNVQFEDVSFFIKASDEKKFLLFQQVKLKVNEHWCLIGMPDAGMRIMITLIQIGRMRYVNEV